MNDLHCSCLHRFCVSLSEVEAEPYVIVDLIARPQDEDALPPARIHLVGGDKDLHIVGIERPAKDAAPAR